MKKQEIKDEIQKYLKISRENVHSNPHKAVKAIKEARRLTKEFDYINWQSFHLLKLRGSNYLSNDEMINDTFEMLVSVIEFFTKLDLEEELLDNYLELGNLYYDTRDFEKAAECYFKVLHLSKKLNSVCFQLAALNNLGIIYYELNMFKKAVEYLEKAVDLLSGCSEDDKFKLILFINLSDAYTHLGRYSLAIKFLNVAEVIVKLNDIKYFEIPLYFSLAKAFSGMSDSERAEHYFDISFDLEEFDERVAFLKNNMLEFARYLFLQQKYEEIPEILDRALEITKVHDLAAHDIYLLYSKYYEKMEMYKKALEFSKRAFYSVNWSELQRNSRWISNMENHYSNLMGGYDQELTKLKKLELRKKSKALEVFYTNIAAISGIGQKITSTLDLESVIKKVYDSINDLIPAKVFGIALYKEEREVLDMKMFLKDQKLHEFKSKDINDKFSLGAICVREKKEIIINDWSKEYKKFGIPDDSIDLSTTAIKSILYFPLYFKDKKIGALTIQHHKADFYDFENINTCRALAGYVAIALNNAMKSRELQEEIEKRKKVEKQLLNLNQKLQNLSAKDPMTSLFNRRSFNRYFNDIWNKSITSEEKVSLILIDIDKFKEYNDNYGHLMGDNCIKEISRVIKTSYKKYTKILGRYGGDEFVIVLNGLDEAEVIEITEIFRENLRKKKIEHKYSSLSEYVTVTIGISTIIPARSNNESTLFHKADEALYEAKNAGRNQIATK